MEPPVEAPVGYSEIPADQPLEPPPIAPAVTATSLDSFSLQDATVGQVHFASEEAELGSAEGAQTELPPVEFAPAEAVAAELASVESAPTEFVPVESAPAEAAPTEVDLPAPVEEAVAPEIAPSESAPEAASMESTPLAATEQAGSPGVQPEVAAPPPAFDWNLFYTVVHKVVVKMSPPPLPAEAVEDLARRLADEIATEIISESSQPPA
jgi:hypothetical protein